MMRFEPLTFGSIAPEIFYQVFHSHHCPIFDKNLPVSKTDLNRNETFPFILFVSLFLTCEKDFRFESDRFESFYDWTYRFPGMF